MFLFMFFLFFFYITAKEFQIKNYNKYILVKQNKIFKNIKKLTTAPFIFELNTGILAENSNLIYILLFVQKDLGWILIFEGGGSGQFFNE